MLKWNGHTHTPYCRHGSPAEAADYLEQAIRLGFDRYTFSEHPPLPQGWVDNEPLMRELAMDLQELPRTWITWKDLKEATPVKLK
ncbi:hypothetical protein N6H14_29405 [Paenibacillus sp. CC-CFT747]|nr:hypothetical protein N6H14_29405 [Paenibacillus sp. CC-CFT747]